MIAPATSALIARGIVLCGLALATAPAADSPSANGSTDAMPEVLHTIQLHVGESTVVRAPWLVKRVSVTNPKIADVQVVAPDQVLLLAKAIGSTDLVMWDEQENVSRARVDVQLDRQRFESELRELFPRATLTVRQWRDVVVVRGVLNRAEQAEQLKQFLDLSQLSYVDMTSVAGVQQVQIQVRVAEVSRTAIRALGINVLGTGEDVFGALTVGPDGGGALVPVNIGPPGGALATTNIPFSFNDAVNVSPGVTLFAGIPRADLQVFLQALAENQYLRILAEPNLIALNGEEASFLAGGEFPIPVVQGTTTGGGTSISIEYREFGVRLRFRPTVLGDGTIRFFVAPEVSELSDRGAVELQGFRVPAVVTRRAETTLEVRSGQTFAMAGLISNKTDARTSRVPGLGDLPVLGALFRSKRYTTGETELVVLVTASLVEPINLASPPPLPGALHSPPNDWEFFGLGRIEGTEPTTLPPAQETWLQSLGLEELRGPGAWATYNTKPRTPKRDRRGITLPVPAEPAQSADTGGPK